MSFNLISPKFHLICDSGGSGLQKILANQTKDIDFTVTVKCGAKLDCLINCSFDHQETFDLQIIAGGICNITDKEGPYISYRDHPTRLQSIRALISEAHTTLGNRLLFCNVPSDSIHKYIAFKHNAIKRRSKDPIVAQPPISTSQKDLEDQVKEQNILIEDEALESSQPSVKLDQAIICSSKKRRGRAKKSSYTKVISYTHLHDEIHGDEKLKKIWCDKLLKAARYAYNNIALATSQGSSQEEDWEDFKRRKHKARWVWYPTNTTERETTQQGTRCLQKSGKGVPLQKVAKNQKTYAGTTEPQWTGCTSNAKTCQTSHTHSSHNLPSYWKTRHCLYQPGNQQKWARIIPSARPDQSSHRKSHARSHNKMHLAGKGFSGQI